MKTVKRLFWRFVHNFIVHGLLIGIIGEWLWVSRLHDWSQEKWTEAIERE